MAKKSDSFEDYTRKLRRVKLNDGPYSRKNLAPLTKHEAEVNDETLSKLVTEGLLLLAQNTKEKPATIDETSKLESKLGKTSPNPYIRARSEVLASYPDDRRKLIELMDKGEKPKDHRYDDFVKDIIKLGDKLSP